ncbi:MAG: hypothetical protein U0325_16100 [Polyangiales bacterium]
MRGLDRRAVVTAMVFAGLLGLAAVSSADPVRMTEARVQLEAPAGWQVTPLGGRMAQVTSPNRIKIDVFTPPAGTNVQPVLTFLRDGPRRGLTWTPEAPVTVGGFTGSTQRATGTVEGTPTTFVQSWVTVRGRLVIFTVQFPTADAASAEASANSVLNTLREAR